MIRVYAVGFRHQTQGEGVGGSEWDLKPGAARERLTAQGVLSDPDYETAESTIDIPEEMMDEKETVTAKVDELFWNPDESTHLEWVPNEGKGNR